MGRQTQAMVKNLAYISNSTDANINAHEEITTHIQRSSSPVIWQVEKFEGGENNLISVKGNAL